VSDRPTREPDAAEAVLDPAVVDSLRQLGERSGRDVLGELTGLFLSTADSQAGPTCRNWLASRTRSRAAAG
jgi:hypothetical protein